MTDDERSGAEPTDDGSVDDPPADDALLDEDAATILDAAGFDADESVLTPRQAEVLALRERGLAQNEIAERLGTSRANVSSVESSARTNVEKAVATVAVAEALEAPIRLQFEADTDLYDVPERVYAACDDADVKVEPSTPELIATVTDQAADAFDGRRLVETLTIAVTAEGEIRVR
jgi:Tfx family DNA-binding protein